MGFKTNSSLNKGFFERRLSYYLISLLIFSIFLFYLFNLIDLINFNLSLKWFLEPAENENLVFTQHIFNARPLDLISLIESGVLPIYPDFYHQLSSLFDWNILSSLRAISSFSFVSSLILIFIWSKLITKSKITSLCIVLIVFGLVDHSFYFLMARVDSLYVFFGLIGLSIIFHLFYDKNYNHFTLQNYLLIFIAGFFLCLSILVKQTALFFTFYSIYIILYFSHLSKSFKYLFTFLAGIIGTMIIYSLLVNNHVLDYFLLGLNGWATDFSYLSFKSHVREIIFSYYGYLLMIILGFYSIYHKKKIFYFWVYSFVIVFLFSTKLFGNIAAFYNNFILFTIVSTLFFIYFFESSENRVSLVMLLIISISVLFPKFYNQGFKNSFKEFQYNQVLNGNFDDHEIFKYIDKNEGEYLSGRNDNFLYFSNREIFYESSVMSSIIPIYDEINIMKIKDPIQKLDTKIRDKINNKDFQAIIDGINNNLSNYSKAINNHYSAHITDTIYSGRHRHEIILYVKK